MLDHSDEELRGPVEGLMLKRFLLEVDHEVLDSQGVLLLSSVLSTVPFDVHVHDFSFCFFSTLTIPYMSIDCLLRVVQLSFMFLLCPLTIVQHKWTCIAFGFGLRTKDSTVDRLKFNWPFTSLRVNLSRRGGWFRWNFIFIANWMLSWYLRHRLCALLEGCFYCCIFDFSQLLHPLLLLRHWI